MLNDVENQRALSQAESVSQQSLSYCMLIRNLKKEKIVTFMVLP